MRGESTLNIEYSPDGKKTRMRLICFCSIYRNDIPTDLHSTTHIFAEDTIVYLVIKCTSDCITLQQNLDKLGIWEKTWKIESHPDKCTCTVLTISRNKHLTT